VRRRGTRCVHSDAQTLLAANERRFSEYAIQKCVGEFPLAPWERDQR
jgi:hypothetical protein